MRRKPKYSNGHLLLGVMALGNGVALLPKEPTSWGPWVTMLCGVWMLVPAVVERVKRARERREQRAA